MFKRIIGECIYFHRVTSNMKQIDLAEKANLSNSCICDIEHGRAFPSVVVLFQICDALEVPVPVFMSEVCSWVQEEKKKAGEKWEGYR